MKFLLLLAASSFSYQSQSFAAPPPFACVSADSIDNDGEGDCEENDKFAKAGQACLKTLEAAIAARANVANAQMAASNLAKTVAAGNSQTNNFSGANADYGISQQALIELVEAAKKARKSVEGQLSHIYYPEDFDAPEDVIGDPMEFLSNTSCYADNEKSLKNTLKTIDQHIVDLEKAKAVSNVKGNTSDGRDQTMKGSVNSMIPSNAAPATAPSADKAGVSKDRVSDVTGIEESKKKNEQKK